MNKYLLFLPFIWLLACTSSSKENPDSGGIYVVTTTGMLYDAVINIGKSKVRAEALMGPGVDPHLYKATQGDLERLNKADLIVYNGLSLEGKMGDILNKLGKRKPVVAAANAVPENQLLRAVGYQNAYDPHVWFDVKRWKYVVNEIGKTLAEQDTANADFYLYNTQQYLHQLDTFNQFVRKQIGYIPGERRILVTAHDAFRYFGDAYGFQVEGIQGVSTVADVGLRDLARLTDLIIQNDIKAIYVETSVSDRTINSLIEGCREQGQDVKIGGYLYSDAMGEMGTEEGTYLGMFKSNVSIIVEGLK